MTTINAEIAESTMKTFDAAPRSVDPVERLTTGFLMIETVRSAGLQACVQAGLEGRTTSVCTRTGSL
jgi:hypothetical protein